MSPPPRAHYINSLNHRLYVYGSADTRPHKYTRESTPRSTRGLPTPLQQTKPECRDSPQTHIHVTERSSQKSPRPRRLSSRLSRTEWACLLRERVTASLTRDQTGTYD